MVYKIPLPKGGVIGKPVKAPEQTEVAKQCGCHTILAYQVSKQYVQEGLGRVLNRKVRETPPVVTGEEEAKIIALCCGEPPAGYSRWTLRLLEEKGKADSFLDLRNDCWVTRAGVALIICLLWQTC
jgi:transposase